MGCATIQKLRSLSTYAPPAMAVFCLSLGNHCVKYILRIEYVTLVVIRTRFNNKFMIGKPEWFRRRKYTGWGFTPVTWQGWAYIAVVILPIVLLTSARAVGQIQMVLAIVWALIFCIDFIDIIIHLPKDERDRMHEAIAERNALWAIIAVLATGVGYQAAINAAHGVKYVDPVILIALFVGVLVKMISNIYLDKKD